MKKLIFSSPIPEHLDFQEYNVLTDPTKWNLVKNDLNLPWDAFLGVLGMPGHTAYSGWKEFAHSKKGDIVFVSGGAGSYGQKFNYQP